MVCSVIDECRCFAYDDVIDPKRYQFCGVRRGPNVLQCPSDCCAGGCPGQNPKAEPREPFRIIERPVGGESSSDLMMRILIFVILLLISYLILT